VTVQSPTITSVVDCKELDSKLKVGRGGVGDGGAIHASLQGSELEPLDLTVLPKTMEIPRIAQYTLSWRC